MYNPKIISFLLIGTGALFLLSAIFTGIQLKNKLPSLLQNRWMQLLWLMIFFFCGHLLVAWLLWNDFLFPHILIAATIFFGGFFSLLLIAHVKAYTKALMESETKFSRASRILKLKDSRLHSEISAHSQTEAELERTNTLFLKDLFEMMVEVLANRDQYTFDHALHVATISRGIGEQMGLSAELLEILDLGCLVHDIGKTAIPDDVLLKPDQFDFQDRKIMDYHPLIGAKLISRHIQDDRITDIIIKHHERLDGSGYPMGLKGDEIGLLPRIVAVADTYDALVSKRPYKIPYSKKKAMTLLRKEALNGQLDTEVVEKFAAIVDSLEELEPTQPITAGFMTEVELFRSRTYFREPLTDFYNYRYLLSLDDAKMLNKNNFFFDLILLRFPGFDKLQLDIGYAVADQVVDELGHNLLSVAVSFSNERKNYDGSVMLFKKGLDYLIYSECEKGYSRSDLIKEITFLLDQAETDWHLVYTIFSRQFDPGTPVVQAICKLFDQTQCKQT